MTIWKSAKLRLHGVLFASLATILGGVLPVIVSGLYKVNQFNHSTSVNVYPLDQFSPSFGPFPVQSTQISAIPAHMLYYNLDGPKWTHGKYALAQLSLERKGDYFLNNSSLESKGQYLNALVPAVYGAANCSIVSQEDTVMDVPEEGGIIFEHKMPNGCPSTRTQYPLESGKLELGSWSAVQPNSTEFDEFLWGVGPNDEREPAKPPAQCPLAVLFIAIGSTDTEAKTATIDESITCYCWPYVGKTLLNTTFLLPDFDILTSHSIQKEESVLTQKHIIKYRPLSFYNPDQFREYLPIGSLSRRYGLDSFIEAVVHGKGGIPFSELFSNSSSPSRLLDRVEEVFSLIVSQTYHEKARVPALHNEDESTSIAIRNGTITDPKASRVFLEGRSMRILQGLLGAMLFCACSLCFLVRFQTSLPDNPCSIGAVAGLLAGSRILTEEIIPRNAEFLDEKELRKTSFMRDQTYSFGWWTNDESTRFGIDVGEARKKR